MIIMDWKDLHKNKYIKYTNCEIHPSLMNGILGVNIPFSDHNQSPRNCYQCLGELEKVLLSNGNYKFIRDIKIGDEIICFNPNDMKTTISKVVHHYNRITNKLVYNIKIISGRTITATYDHKFITNQGWMEVKNLDKTMKLGIHIHPEYLDNTPKEVVKILHNLKNDDYYMPVIARLIGYYQSNNFIFPSKEDEESYDNDVIMIGFKNLYDIKFRIFMDEIIAKLDEWIMKSSLLVKREYLAGYLSNNYIKNKFIHQLLDEFQLPNPTDFYNQIGIRYNYKKLQTLAIKYEYSKYLLEIYRNDEIIKKLSFEEFSKIIECKGNMIFIPFLSKFLNTNNHISDLTIENYDYHSFIGGAGFAVSNCAMGKQALGIYMSNFNNRTDTMGNIINYPQRHIVSTKLSKYTYSNELPSGVNAIVAIMTHTGFNQEDSIMINKSALDRGLFTSTYYKIIRDQCTKNHSSGEEEIFVNPKSMCSIKNLSYDKLEEDGFCPKNSYVENGDVIVGKVMPRKINGKTTYQDNSISMKANDDGYIDMNYIGTNSEGYKFCKIRIRKNRKPEIGDKLASRSAQKGSLGMVYDHKDMPFTKEGIVPDIIINPHAIPSRMTMAQLLECIMGKVGCQIGAYGDATPFSGCSVDDISKHLEDNGMEKYGNEIMYNGRTGEQIKTEIFIGPTYYQRLKHMVTDKIHSRGSNGPIVMLTRQCSEGRARGGGLRLGEMERDCFIGHGSALFLKEKMLDCADNYRVFICKECGMIASVNIEKNIYKCHNCKNSNDIVQVRIPYAFKLLTQELQTMNVVMRYICE
jgi:hypothetical protein